jgi:hypothetical protein
MRRHYQLYLLIFILTFLGLSAALYKHYVLGFTFTPGGKESVWQIQGKIKFEAEGGPVKVSMTLPADDDARKRLLAENLASDYQVNIQEKDGKRMAVWSKQEAKGDQYIYIRGDFYFQEYGKKQVPVKADNADIKDLTEIEIKAARKIIQKAELSAQSDYDIAMNIIAMMHEENNNKEIRLLLENIQFRREHMIQVGKVLSMANIPSRVVRGIRLLDGLTQRSITTFIKIYADDKWQLIDPRDQSKIPEKEVILWPHDTRGLLDVSGGKNSSIHFSVLKQEKNISSLAVDSARQSESALVNFSIYSLPIKDQNTFKLLLLIPFGALVVVILRNLVGIRTSGTFMPILIALAFMQTTLLLGLVLFLVVVSVGLIMRGYLSHLNLLLVPRIASVLVFVIIIFAFIGIASYKLGWESGLTITVFPMIILSWTIERMSILWEEEGPREVLIQGSGSLVTASLAYLVMINPYVGHLTFNFPELLLVLLAIIIAIGSYSGFRLVELARFEPMTRDQK